MQTARMEAFCLASQSHVISKRSHRPLHQPQPQPGALSCRTLNLIKSPLRCFNYGSAHQPHQICLGTSFLTALQILSFICLFNCFREIISFFVFNKHVHSFHLLRNWLVHQHPRYIVLTAEEVLAIFGAIKFENVECPDITLNQTLNNDAVDVVLRRFNQLDALVANQNSAPRWRYFIESDFAVCMQL